jgi:hypothetical protein
VGTLGILRGLQNCQSAGETPADSTGKMPVLHHALPQQLVLSGQQILHDIITAFIGVARGAGEMMINLQARGVTKVTVSGIISSVALR